MKTGLFNEFLLTMRFGAVGLFCTISHILILWFLVQRTSIPIVLANVIAFGINFGINFAGNYIWTFGAPGLARQALYRFLLLSLAALLLNNVILLVLLKFSGLDPRLIAVTSTIAIPMVTFILSRFWVFKPVFFENSSALPDRVGANNN